MTRIPLSLEDRDLNKKVAHALGWKEVKALKVQNRNSLLLEGLSPHAASPHWPTGTAGFRARQYVPNYAGDMNSALELLEELRQRGYHGATLSRCQRSLSDGNSESRWECFLEDPLGRRVAEFSDTPARAVCLALLNALGLPEQSACAQSPARRPKARSLRREPRVG